MQIRQIFQVFLQMSAQTAAAPAAHPVRICCGSCCCLTSYGRINSFRAIPHNSKCRYGERGAADVKPKAQIILDAAKVSAASGGNSEPKQGQRSQSARGFCPRSTMRVPQPDIIKHFGNADAVPQLPERCLSRKAGIMRCCQYFLKLQAIYYCLNRQIIPAWFLKRFSVQKYKLYYLISLIQK